MEKDSDQMLKEIEGSPDARSTTAGKETLPNTNWSGKKLY
jgi:hypothetical protein